jgi:hypothetical protein
MLEARTHSNQHLEQNPYAGAKPVIGKAMIVCPVSLVNVCETTLLLCGCLILSLQNWKVEFHKW